MATNKNAVHLRWNEYAIISRRLRRYANDDKITKTEIRHVYASDDDPFAEKRKKMSIVFADFDYAFDCKTVLYINSSNTRWSLIEHFIPSTIENGGFAYDAKTGFWWWDKK